MSDTRPLRSEVWLVDFGETVGHEQAGTRPAIIVSVDAFNRGPSALAIVVPLTTRQRVSAHFEVLPPEGGLDKPSYALWDQLCRVSHRRLIHRLGMVSDVTMGRLEARLKALLGLTGPPTAGRR